MTIVWTGGEPNEPRTPNDKQRTAIALVAAWILAALAFYFACWR